MVEPCFIYQSSESASMSLCVGRTVHRHVRRAGKPAKLDHGLTQDIHPLTPHNIGIMATNQPTNKSLAIVGSGADTAIGNLIYRFRGIDLPMLAKLQEKGINTYDHAVKELRDLNEELYFYTPSHRVTVNDQISTVDGFLLVITPPPQASNTYFSSNTVNRLKESAPLFAQKKAVVLIRTPENRD
ncbi:uncharacterized protein M421DRAFT_355284 [Didymella exigua CBS 183.55]|uniref:Uncharacterized protein n=1 Tax=Didymella exigua CBS 183.55 TaxID=1150837 RepID=A0A6A5R5P2_9PLEO|nr:uncharacterized protein M421DRAFT_355284 [Didymella exigua CBS 183.55]KAF1922510.1 hypothetical protein M421DRAFT_355284 [Didymella exigua CBS 183.55]